MPNHRKTKPFALPANEPIVAMIEHKGRLIMATTRALYEVVDTVLIPIPMVVEDQSQ